MPDGRPVVFGEVLFDCFEEEATLGGAPFNVAWHLQGFGLNPLFISRLGDDSLGGQVLAAMERWGMDTTGVQQDRERPTGRVQVTLQNRQPQYEILPDQAFDYIDHPAVSTVLEQHDLAQLYHGTLALRNDVSEATLLTLRERSGLPVFIDVNLRSPWWDLPKVTEIVQGANCLKLNEEELAWLQSAESGGDEPERALHFKEKLGAQVVLVTKGEAGAFGLTPAGGYSIPAGRVDGLVDTVGAGDAFSAVVILGMLRSWSWEDTLQRAASFAARICEYRGAIQEDRGLYERAAGRWRYG